VVWLAQPLLSLLYPTARLQQLAHLLEEPAALQALHRQLATEDKR
jgi:hypothetical protein